MGRKISVHQKSGNNRPQITVDWSIFGDKIEDPVGFTTSDVAKNLNVSQRTALNRIKKLIDRGKIKLVGYTKSGNAKTPVYNEVK